MPDLPRLPSMIFLREHGRNLRSVDSKYTIHSLPAGRSALTDLWQGALRRSCGIAQPARWYNCQRVGAEDFA